jgi:hypothetical protein
MKQIDESAINSQNGMLSPSGVLQFLQTMTKDSVQNLIIGLSQNISSTASGVFALSGMTNLSGTPSTQWLSNEGVAYYNGELFYVPQSTLTTLVNIPVVVLATNFNNIAANADPVLFTDGTARNVLQTRTLQIVDGTSATAGYICNASALGFLTNVGNVATPYVQNGSGGTTTSVTPFTITGGITVSKKCYAKITATFQLRIAGSIIENAQIKITKNGTGIYTTFVTLNSPAIANFYSTVTISYFTGTTSVQDAWDITVASVGGNPITISAVNALIESI